MKAIRFDPFRAVAFQEQGWWVAQCVDFEICAQAKNLDDLRYELERLIIGRVIVGTELGIDPWGTLPPPPKEFLDMYNEAGDTSI